MGCSPSKGNLLLKPGKQEALVGEPPQESVDFVPSMVENTCLKLQEKEKDTPQYTDKTCSKETFICRLDSDPTITDDATDIKAIGVNEMSQETVRGVLQAHMTQRGETEKKNNKRRSTDRQRRSSVQTKVDFLPHMVRAHQAAYGFLNPNISKYETLLGLLDQATQTQLSLQSIVSALALYFEEINQALEEMAEEGELMLKQHGDSMSLPTGMVSQAVRSDKLCNTALDPIDPPPDLLHQLLQQSSDKMRLVGSSVKNLGDTTLEEIKKYFSCLSKLFAEKLQAKQAAELRLAQVLARIEMSAIKKSNPEDSALHSEDSGIGGESESLAGSERHQRHRSSAGSGSCGSIVNVQSMFGHYQNNLAGFVTSNKDDEKGEEEDAGDDDDDVDVNNDDESDRCGRRRSSSSPPDPCHALRYMCANAMKNQQPTFERLFTETKTEHESSRSCINMLIELQKTQKDLNRKMKKISELQEPKDFKHPCSNLFQARHRRHSLHGCVNFHKSLGRRNQPPCSLTSLQLQLHQPQNCHSVKRLINAFSQGMDGRPGQCLQHISPHIMRLDKIPTSNREDLVTGNKSRSCTGGRDDLDMDNLPPPPPEVLMDNSFQHNEEQLQNEKLCGDPVLSLPLIHPNTHNTQRRKKVMQNVDVLPNKVNLKQKPIAVSPVPPIRRNRPTEFPQLQVENFEKNEKTKGLYKQARKIVQICNAGESNDSSLTFTGDLTSPQVTNDQSCERNDTLESEMPLCKLPVIAPPVSRVRLTEACHSVHHSFPRPPMFRPYSNSLSSSRSNCSTTVTCANDNSTERIIPSLSFHDARSVFCKKELQSPQATQPIGSSLLPRKWGEIPRGRLSTRGRDNPTRRTQSEQRPGMTSYLDFERHGYLSSQEDEPSVEK